MRFENRPDIVIEMAANTGAIKLADVFLQSDDAAWLQPSSMPVLPLDAMDHGRAGKAKLPVLYGRRDSSTGTYIRETGRDVYCGIDLFGGAFFMLTRYEEIVNGERGRHDRFEAHQSIASQADFLDRPIVNEYVELLWSWLHGLWPALTRKQRNTRLIVSHDVDFPFYSSRRSWLSIAKESISDVIRRYSPATGMKKARMLLNRNNTVQDPFNTFEWLMDISEQADIRSAFYFICEDTGAKLDGNYSIYEDRIQELMRNMHKRGHEIGLHPTIDTYMDRNRIQFQFNELLKVASANDIRQQAWGGRQHYLKWKAPFTWQYWEDAGLQYDSTLSYADRVGFRCGTCYEYPVFNVLTRTSLQLRERPLIVMEQSILDKAYMAMDKNRLFDSIASYYDQCKKFNGDFTLLWHNSQLMKPFERSVYRQIVEYHTANSGRR